VSPPIWPNVVRATVKHSGLGRYALTPFKVDVTASDAALLPLIPVYRAGSRRRTQPAVRIIAVDHIRAVICVYDAADNVIETHEHNGDFKEW